MNQPVPTEEVPEEPAEVGHPDSPEDLDHPEDDEQVVPEEVPPAAPDVSPAAPEE